MNLKNSAENVGRVGHERIGSEYLRSLGFSPSVCQLVESHVAAKRYSSSFFFPTLDLVPGYC